ncbi:MAG: hypothetical protein F4044_09395 [Rhodobacteraceae bacterium]|nr:hypothetical protein [Paracoccaceae bacterium]
MMFPRSLNWRTRPGAGLVPNDPWCYTMRAGMKVLGWPGAWKRMFRTSGIDQTSLEVDRRAKESVNPVWWSSLWMPI